MDGLAPPGAGVADTIGTFTTTIRVAQDMFLAGLPCWLIQSSSMFSDEKIFSIAEIFSPKDYIVLELHKHNYPINFKGPATNFELESDQVVEQRVGAGDSSQMTVKGMVRLSPLGGIVVTIT